MNSASAQAAPGTQANSTRTFPRLTSSQVAKIAVYGRVRATRSHEVLVRTGEHSVPFFVVLTGEVEVIQQGLLGETHVVAHGPGEFTGEVNMLTGRASLVQMRVSEGGEILELERSQLLLIIQNDAEISEILMRAFILRRALLMTRGLGDVVLLGSRHCSGTLRVKEFLSRNSLPYAFIDLDADSDVQSLLDRFRVGYADVPVFIFRGQRVLRNPSNAQIAACMELNEPSQTERVRDVIVVGAGPAGLSAAVYAASEGLDVVMLESRGPGGQAGSSSRIENYLGFPTGISGQTLAGRALTQAQKFGAHLVVARTAERLECGVHPYLLRLDEGGCVRGRTVVIATGAEYRKLILEGLPRFEGLGVYYAATFMEAQLCAGEEVLVIGGANSAGQAAVFLAESARRVHLLVRASSLAATMSRYLIHRIENHPAIQMHFDSVLTSVEGSSAVERVSWRNQVRGTGETRPIRHVFVMTGAAPATGWVSDCIALDAHGFIKTGPALTRDDLADARWNLDRVPHLLETSVPGVFAVGDVRSGNIKRIASAVGEGAIAISFVHKVLAA